MITKEQCDYIVANNRNNAFYRYEHTVNGVNCYTYNYRITAMVGDFANPTGAQTQSHVLNGHWLRGITFVETESGHETWPMLPKFFNYNQTESVSYAALKDKRILMVYPKYDGSLITYVKIGDKWLPKTQNSFDNEQTELINKHIETPVAFLEEALASGYAVTFELVSPSNRIVLPYESTELKPLFYIHKQSGALLPTAALLDECEEMSFDDLIYACDNLEDIEGFVAFFADGQLVKFKTEWYFERHALKFKQLTPMGVLHLWLESKIDDILPMIAYSQEETDKVLGWVQVFSDKYNWVLQNAYKEFGRIYKETGGVRRWFYDAARKTELLHYLMVLYEIPGASIESEIKRQWSKKLTKEYRVKEYFKL